MTVVMVTIVMVVTEVSDNDSGDDNGQKYLMRKRRGMEGG